MRLGRRQIWTGSEIGLIRRPFSAIMGSGKRLEVSVIKQEFERIHHLMEKNEKWLQWAVELQSLAQAGLFYCKDKMDELPRLAEEKNNREQIEMCFKAMNSETWEVLYD